MKRSLLITALILSAVSANYGQYHYGYARDFKPFKLGAGVGYGVAVTGKGAGDGLLLYLEPAYRPTDEVLVGLRLERAYLLRGTEGVDGWNVSGSGSSVFSYTLNGQYYFSDDDVRPFIGAGVGLFSLAAISIGTTSSTDPEGEGVPAETRFGFYPRIGADIGHFNLIFEYNVIPPTDFPGGGEIKNEYLAVKAGYSLGGGRSRDRLRARSYRMNYRKKS